MVLFDRTIRIPNWSSPMFAHRPLAAILTVLGILLTSPTSVSAGFLSVSGGGNILDPATTPTGATRDFFNDRGADRLVHAWNEQQDLTLDRDLFVDLVHPAVCRRDNDL